MKSMKKLTKRILAAVAALGMCSSVFTTTVFAEEAGGHSHNPLDCEACRGSGQVEVTEDCPDCDGPAEAAMIACEACEGKGTVTEKIFSWDNPPCPNNGYACGGCADCNHGYAWVYEEISCEDCNGLGQYVDPDFEACATCGGLGMVTTLKDCEACAGAGKVSCTGEFTPGELVKNADGTGTITYACKTCGASYNESRTHEEVVAELGEAGHVMSTEATEHKDAACTEDGYSKYICAVNGCDGEAIAVIPATGHSKPGAEEITTIKEATCTEEGETSYTCTQCGETITETIPAKKHNLKNGVCTECGAVRVTVYGVNMGHWYGYTPSAAVDSRTVTLNADTGIRADNLGFDPHEGRDEFVTNYATTKLWQCVGFVPETTGWGYKQDKLASNYVYTDSEDAGKFKSCTGLDEVKAYVEENGVLYGEPVPASMAGEIVAVWFVADTSVKPGQFGEYDLTIDPVTAPALKENSTGVSIGVDPDAITYEKDSNGRGYYNIDLVVRIGADAPNDAHVNIVPGLVAAEEAIRKGEGFQPGDRFILNISIDNQSGRTYTYVNNSGIIATNNFGKEEAGAESAGTGFDGFRIPVSDIPEFAFIARRIDNQPLKDLGLTNNVSDEAVGAALAVKGYGKDENLTNAEIAQTYLANYYLDWTNAARSIKGLEPVSSFQELSIAELAVFTNGTTGEAVFESCQSVAEGLYYFYYGALFTYNEESIYEHMKDCAAGTSELETAIPAALAGTPFAMNTGKIDGEYGNNGFQNTQFGFRLEFDLTAAATPEEPDEPDEPEEPTIPYYPETPDEEEEIPEEPTPLTPPDEEIPEEEVPLAPPEEEIPEEDIPLVDAPKTGNTAQPWILALLIPFAGLILAVVGKKRKHL